MQLPAELQKELVEKAAAKYGNCQELAKHLNIPKSSVHYYRIGRVTMPVSVMERMLEIAGDLDLKDRITDRGITKDRTWANEYAVSVYREMCRDKVRLPTRKELEEDDELRRKAASIISYVLAEGSVWLQKEKWGECVVNITFALHETDLYEHFRSLCKDVFLYDIGPPQRPGNEAQAIRGFIYSRFVAEWLIENGVMPGEKAARELHLPRWIMDSVDSKTWVSALQPWCDGEGSAAKSVSSRSVSFRISQSRHTPLDVNILPCAIIENKRARISSADLIRLQTLGISAYDYCESSCRSEILDDVSTLFNRLGMTPKLDLDGLDLKDNGFWSCRWTMRFGVRDSGRLVGLGLVIQDRKRMVLESGRK